MNTTKIIGFKCIRNRILCQAERGLLLGVLGCKKGKRSRGLEVRENLVIAGCELRAGDQLHPSADLPDVFSFSSTPVPVTLTFWRPHVIRRICRDPVLHRNPIFARDLGTSPGNTMVVDALHTVYLGPMMRFVRLCFGVCS